MIGCSECSNYSDLTVIGKCVGCNRCKKIIYEKRINERKNKNITLNKILKEFN